MLSSRLPATPDRFSFDFGRVLAAGEGVGGRTRLAVVSLGEGGVDAIAAAVAIGVTTGFVAGVAPFVMALAGVELAGRGSEAVWSRACF